MKVERLVNELESTKAAKEEIYEQLTQQREKLLNEFDSRRDVLCLKNIRTRWWLFKREPLLNWMK